ncbi:MAG: hypothetical protein QXI71_04835 [Candidatus Bathyarchaeia archaeon]
MSVELADLSTLKPVFKTLQRISPYCVFEFTFSGLKVWSIDPDERCAYIVQLKKPFFKRYRIENPAKFVVDSQIVSRFLDKMNNQNLIAFDVGEPLVICCRTARLNYELRPTSAYGKSAPQPVLRKPRRQLAAFRIENKLFAEMLEHLWVAGDEALWCVDAEEVSVEIRNNHCTYSIKFIPIQTKCATRGKIRMKSPTVYIRMFPAMIFPQSTITLKFFEEGAMSILAQRTSVDLTCYVSARLE